MEKKNPDAIAICLNCYKIRFREKNKSVPKTVENVFGKTDIVDILQDYIRKVDSKSVFKNFKEDRILYLKETLSISKENNIYAGIIMKGHNGPQTSIDELVKNEVKTVGTVSKDQFHCLPYFFLLYLNREKPEDILFIAQSYRQYGFKEVFEESFKSFVATISEDTTVLINPLSVASLFEKYIKDGLINKMRFVKHGLHKGVESIVQGDKIDLEDYETELSIKSKKGFWGIKDRLKYNDASFIEQVQIDGFEYTEAYADVVVGGRKRVLNVYKPSDFSSAFDITHEVDIDINTKLPDFKDILKQAVDILNNDLIPYL